MEKTISQADTKKQLPDRHQQLLHVIPYGQDNAITVSSIISQIGGTSEGVRSMVKEMILEYGQKIGSCRSGFFKIQNLKEKQVAVAMLVSRRNQLNRRIKALEDAPTDDQLSMYEVESEAVR